MWSKSFSKWKYQFAFWHHAFILSKIYSTEYSIFYLWHSLHSVLYVHATVWKLELLGRIYADTYTSGKYVNCWEACREQNNLHSRLAFIFVFLDIYAHREFHLSNDNFESSEIFQFRQECYDKHFVNNPGLPRNLFSWGVLLMNLYKNDFSHKLFSKK
jgi:hypothetical protein